MSKIWDNFKYQLELRPALLIAFYVAVVLLCGVALFWFYRLVRFLWIGGKVHRALRKAPKGTLYRNRHIGAWASGKAKKTDLFFDAGDCVYAIKYFSVQPLGRKLVFSSEREWLLEKKLIAQKAFQAAGYTAIRLPEYDVTKGMPAHLQGKECKKAYLFCPAPATFCRYADREGELYALQEIYGFALLTPSTLARFFADPGQITQSSTQKKRFFEE